MKGTNAIAVGLILSSFALLGTWAGTVGNVGTTNTVLDRGIEGVSEPDSCPVTDKTGGFGGQDMECAFACAYPGVGSLSVSANDGDATVSGGGSCNGISFLSCSSETNYCDDTGRVPAGGAGLCSGSSSEFYDSGLTVSCSTELDNVVDDPIFEEWCPVIVDPWFTLCLRTPPPILCSEEGCPEPIVVCTTTDCEGGTTMSGSSGRGNLPLQVCFIAYGTSGRTLCHANLPWDEKVRIATELARMVHGNMTKHLESTSAHLAMVDGAALGLVCWHHNCTQHLPSCSEFKVAGGAKCDLS